MGDQLSTPTCGKCRWQKRAFGVKIDPYAGIYLEGNEHLGLHYCEHPKQPRGLVATNYACPNFERPPQISDDGQLSGTGRSYEDMLP